MQILLKLIFSFFIFHNLIASANAKPREKIVCVYTDGSQELKQAPQLERIPAKFRQNAKCGPEEIFKNQILAKPEEINLSGNIREEKINSSIGVVHIKWQRKVESLFGRTPLRAMADAANTVARTLKNPAFPKELQSLNIPWEIIFLDENLADYKIPFQLVSNCHPGWMTPPTNIYIVAQRVAGGCGGQTSSSSVADSTLTEVLIHEMGHAIEYQLLKEHNNFERARAEGFATWFERYSAQNSSILSKTSIESKHFAAAKYAIKKSPEKFDFQGSYEDYMRASMIFSAIEGVKGVQGVIDIYLRMNRDNLKIIDAISLVLNWNQERINSEINNILKRY